MFRDEMGQAAEIRELKRRIRVLETQAPVGFTAVSRGALRIASNEGLIVDGSAKVDGWLVVTGTEKVDGRLEGSGTFDWTGPVNLKGAQSVTGPTTFTGMMTVNGPWKFVGNGEITGTVAISGNVTLNSDLTLGSGRIVAGPVTIDKLGVAGGRIASSGQMIVDGASVYLGSSTTVNGPLSCTGDFFASGDVGGGSKSFWIDHPTTPGKLLRHGSLEGPEHAVFYRGVVDFDAAGEATFQLPDYYSALVLPDGVPTVHVTAIGRPYLVGAELVEGGRVVVYGDANRQAHVTVVAARELFDVEPVKPAPEPLPETVPGQ